VCLTDEITEVLEQREGLLTGDERLTVVAEHHLGPADIADREGLPHPVTGGAVAAEAVLVVAQRLRVVTPLQGEFSEGLYGRAPDR